jgi:hypothetical protein
MGALLSLLLHVAVKLLLEHLLLSNQCCDHIFLYELLNKKGAVACFSIVQNTGQASRPGRPFRAVARTDLSKQLKTSTLASKWSRYADARAGHRSNVSNAVLFRALAIFRVVCTVHLTSPEFFVCCCCCCCCCSECESQWACSRYPWS